MKKAILIISLVAVILAVSCGTTGVRPASDASAAAASGRSRQVDGKLPQFVKDAVKNVPEDAIIGIGTARMASLNQSRTISATRARAELSRQMNTMIRDMVRDYTAGSELDPKSNLSFQETITVALSQSKLQGASIVDEDLDEAGNYWTVVMLSKTTAVQEINQAVSAAKLKVPAMASFNAEERMNQAFENYLGSSEIGFSDKD